MHLMILQAYVCDLCYGISHQLPWQYLTVSCIGLFFICIQHGQWYQFKRQQHEANPSIFLYLGAIALSWPWLIKYQLNFDWQLQINGWVSRVFFMAHFLPQIWKNHQRKPSRAVINPHYLMLSITLSLLDLLAAYLLHWGWVNMLGGVCSLSLKLILAKQIFNPWISLERRLFYSKVL